MKYSGVFQQQQTLLQLIFTTMKEYGAFQRNLKHIFISFVQLWRQTHPVSALLVVELEVQLVLKMGHKVGNHIIPCWRWRWWDWWFVGLLLFFGASIWPKRDLSSHGQYSIKCVAKICFSIPSEWFSAILCVFQLFFYVYVYVFQLFYVSAHPLSLEGSGQIENPRFQWLDLQSKMNSNKLSVIKYLI